MKVQSALLAALASVPAVMAHTVFTDFYVDRQPQVGIISSCLLPNTMLTATRVMVLPYA